MQAGEAVEEEIAQHRDDIDEEMLRVRDGGEASELVCRAWLFGQPYKERMLLVRGGKLLF